jgi:hypothetical protein
VFDPSKSKYGLNRQAQVLQSINVRKDAPYYLKNEQMYKEFIQKDYK